jgi:DNA-binding response OmpR family regulator
VSHTILLIEDDLSLAETTTAYLENYGFSVIHEEDGQLGFQRAKDARPDLILLDLMLPTLDGWEVCRRLREEAALRHIPILMLTARTDEMDRVVGLEMGADDYLTKPYSLRELVARVRANLRRATMEQPVVEEVSEVEGGEEETVVLEGLRIDRRTRQVQWQEQEVDLTATEFELLWIFASYPGQVFTREQLLDRVRGRDFEVFDRSIDVHVSKLRKKLEPDPKKPRWLKTVWGVGYQFLLQV